MQKNQKDKSTSCCSTINKLLTLLDFFGQSPQFTILKKEKFTSKIGLFSTLIVNAICLSYFLFQVKALVERQNPSVVQYDTQLLESGEIPLVMSNFSLAVTLNDANSLPLDRKYFNVTIQNCARVKTRNQTTNEMTISNTCVTYPTETCITDHFVTQVQKDYVANIFLPSTVCIQRDAWESNPPKLQGVVASSIQKYISVRISVCRNSTTYNGCPPIEEIQEHMKSEFNAVLMNDNLLNMDNANSPLNQMIVVHRTTFSISTSRSIYQTFRIIDSITDFPIKQEQYCCAIAFYNDGQIMAAACSTDIRLWKFENEQICQIIANLQGHTRDVGCLVYSKTKNWIASGSEDKCIRLWKDMGNNQWQSLEQGKKHNSYISCLLMNEQEDQLISGSADQSIKIWRINFETNELTFDYSLDKHQASVYPISLNETQTSLVSSGSDLQILIWEKGVNQKWQFKESINKSVNDHGFRVCFINDQMIAWQQYSKGYTPIFKLENGKFLEKPELKIQFKQAGTVGYYFFPTVFNKQKQIMIQKYNKYVYIIDIINIMILFLLSFMILIILERYQNSQSGRVIYKQINQIKLNRFHSHPEFEVLVMIFLQHIQHFLP